MKLFGLAIGDVASPTAPAGQAVTLRLSGFQRDVKPAGVAATLDRLLEPLGMSTGLVDRPALLLNAVCSGEVLLRFQCHADAVEAAHALRGATLSPDAPAARVGVGWAPDGEAWARAKPPKELHAPPPGVLRSRVLAPQPRLHRTLLY
jgi:hypothetical protein